MPLIEGQFKIRDLVLGRGTAYELLTDTNPFDRHVRAEQSGPRAWNHGSWSGVEWQDEAVIPFHVFVSANGKADWVQARHELARAFSPVGESVADVELRFAMGGREYLVRGRPRMVEHDLELIGLGKSYTSAAFVALNPLIFDATESSAGPISPPTFSGGLTVPLTVPFTVDAVASGGGADLLNEGTADTGLSLRIDGPASEPFVALKRSDATYVLRFAIDLASGQWLDVDTAARTVLLGGTSSRRGQTSADPDWPLLPPGTHRIEYRSADGLGTLTVKFRSAYW